MPQQPYGGFSSSPPNYTTFMQPQTMGTYADHGGSTPPPGTNDMYMEPPEPFPNRLSSNGGLLPPFLQSSGGGDYGGGSGGGGLYAPTSSASPFSSGPPIDESLSMHATSGTDMREMSSDQAFRKSRPKTARQQQLNKLAQQRYRYDMIV